jgi:hypothetical protein
MDWVNIIISLLSGIIGGNATGAAMKEKSMGGLANSITGLLGGGTSNYIMQALGLLASAAATSGAAPGAHGLDIGSLIGNIIGSGAGGAILTAIVTLIKNAMEKRS